VPDGPRLQGVRRSGPPLRACRSGLAGAHAWQFYSLAVIASSPQPNIPTGRNAGAAAFGLHASCKLGVFEAGHRMYGGLAPARHSRPRVRRATAVHLCQLAQTLACGASSARGKAARCGASPCAERRVSAEARRRPALSIIGWGDASIGVGSAILCAGLFPVRALERFCHSNYPAVLLVRVPETQSSFSTGTRRPTSQSWRCCWGCFLRAMCPPGATMPGAGGAGSPAITAAHTPPPPACRRDCDAARRAPSSPDHPTDACMKLQAHRRCLPLHFMTLGRQRRWETPWLRMAGARALAGRQAREGPGECAVAFKR
jgi:hypothetical protein